MDDSTTVRRRPSRLYQVLIELHCVFRAISHADENEVEAGHNVAVIVECTGRLHKISRAIRMAWIKPPLGTIVGLCRGWGQREFIIARRHDPLAGPFAPMQSQVAETSVLARECSRRYSPG